MKKLFNIVLLLVTVLVIGSNTYAAEIYKADLNIDGICLDQPVSEVFARYGQPVKVEYGVPNGRICIYKINDGELLVSVTGIDDDGTVTGVKITGATGLSTKAGIKVGSTAEEVAKAYGGNVPDRNLNIPRLGVQGATHVSSYTDKLEHEYKYNPAFNKYIDYGPCYIMLWFYLDENNNVVGISFWREYTDC